MRACYHAAVAGFVLLALLATDPIASDGGVADLGDAARRITQALLDGDVEGLTALCPIGFAFDGRQAWTQADIRAEWTRALGRRALVGVKILGVEVMGYDEMLARYGPPPERWSKINLGGTRIATVDLEGRPLLVIFRKRGDSWVPMGVSD
jgi:hypothetical protein